MIWSAPSRHHAVMEKSLGRVPLTGVQFGTKLRRTDQTIRMYDPLHSPCINSFINSLFVRTDIYVCIRLCILRTLVNRRFRWYRQLGMAFSRFSAPLALGLDDMLQICRCALSGDGLVFNPHCNDEMRCCMLLCKPIARSHL